MLTLRLSRGEVLGAPPFGDKAVLAAAGNSPPAEAAPTTKGRAARCAAGGESPCCCAERGHAHTACGAVRYHCFLLSLATAASSVPRL